VVYRFTPPDLKTIKEREKPLCRMPCFNQLGKVAFCFPAEAAGDECGSGSQRPAKIGLTGCLDVAKRAPYFSSFMPMRLVGEVWPGGGEPVDLGYPSRCRGGLRLRLMVWTKMIATNAKAIAVHRPSQGRSAHDFAQLQSGWPPANARPCKVCMP